MATGFGSACAKYRLYVPVALTIFSLHGILGLDRCIDQNRLL